MVVKSEKQMNHILIELMSELTPLSESEKMDIESSFPIEAYEKGTFLTREGQIVSNAYYVIEGFVREYELVDGEEKTTAFYSEGQSAINFNCIANQVPSKINFVCGERTTVAILNAEKEKELYRKHPRFETFCRTGMEKMMGVKQNQLTELITLKPEKRYEKLQQESPQLLNRVPQYQIASYLGVTPEALSRIRNRIANKLSD
ncbi:MAG: Crp/Fnr family transcriptional regulator [Cyclobacteriaceae bacterium]